MSIQGDLKIVSDIRVIKVEKETAAGTMMFKERP